MKHVHMIFKLFQKCDKIKQVFTSWPKECVRGLAQNKKNPNIHVASTLKKIHGGKLNKQRTVNSRLLKYLNYNSRIECFQGGDSIVWIMQPVFPSLFSCHVRDIYLQLHDCFIYKKFNMKVQTCAKQTLKQIMSCMPYFIIYLLHQNSTTTGEIWSDIFLVLLIMLHELKL